MGKRKENGKNAANPNMCHADGRAFPQLLFLMLFFALAFAKLTLQVENRGWEGTPFSGI